MSYFIMQTESCLRSLPASNDVIKLVESVKEMLMQAKPDVLEQDELHDFID